MTTQEKLIAIYEQAEKRLFAIIQKKGAFASAAVYERSLLQQVQKELNRLKANSAKTVDELVIENYQSSLNELIEDLKKIGAPIDTDITPAQLAMSKLNTRQIELIARNATGDFNKAINIIGRRTQDMIRTVTLEATAQKLSTGQTVRQMQKSLTEIFKAQNVFSVPYKNGASMPIKKYAEMTARSTTAETQNKAQTTQGIDWGYDLVEMTSHSPTCPICAMYQGRVYAITKEAANGKYKAPDGTPLMFPYLYDTAFAKGYETIHPNCRHRIAIFPARAYKKEELLKFSQKSTAPFEDTRTDAECKAYAEQQAEKRRRNENRKQYERIKAVLPNDSPKSFAGFVRMKQANSEKYQELMSDYRYIMRQVRDTTDNQDNSKAVYLGTMNRFQGLSSDLQSKTMQINSILDKYTSKPSKWSGKVNILPNEKMPGALGRKEWDCSITYRENVETKTVIHELLHARSASYYSPKDYVKCRFLEEGSVEFFAQEICKQNNVDYKRASYLKQVRYIKAINRILEIEKNEFEFAQKLFDIDMTMRYNFLKDIAEQKMKDNQISRKNIKNLKYLLDAVKGGIS